MLSKTSLIVASSIVAGLSLSVLALTQELSPEPTVAADQPWAGSIAEQKFQRESVECAAYYQLAAEAMARMNAPQMQMVAQRMQSSVAAAKKVAENYFTAQTVTKLILDARQQHLTNIPSPDALGPLMGRYKNSCGKLISDPEKRLSFWQQQHSAGLQETL